MSCPQERKKRSLWKGRKKEWEKKEKTGEKWAYPQLSIVKRGRQRNFIWERESARKEVSTTYLRFFMRCIRGKVNCTVPPPPPKKKNSLKLPALPLTLKTTNTTTFSLFSVFQHWQCLSPRHPLFLFVVMYAYIVPWSVCSSPLCSACFRWILSSYKTNKKTKHCRELTYVIVVMRSDWHRFGDRLT